MMTALLTPSGCTTPPPAGLAARADDPRTPGDEAEAIDVLNDQDPDRINDQLDESDEEEIQDAFRELADGERVVDRAMPAPQGARWTDVPLALKAAGAHDGVEIAVVARRLSRDGRTWRFELRTIEDWPGLMVVRRVPETVYEVEAEVGIFPEAPRSIARRDALIAAFHDEMRQLGKRRQFPGLDE